MMSTWPAHQSSCFLPVSTLIGCADAWLVLQYFNCNSASKYQINLNIVTLYSDNFLVSVGHKLGHTQLDFLLRVSKLTLKCPEELHTDRQLRVPVQAHLGGTENPSITIGLGFLFSIIARCQLGISLRS